MTKTTPDGKHVNLLLEDKLFKAVDDFRYKHRFPTRTEAIRWLLQFALDQKPKPEADKESS